MKSIFKTAFLLLFCISVSFVIHASEDWWPKLHFPKTFYNQGNPRVFLDFVKKLQSKNILVQEYVENQVMQQRNEAVNYCTKPPYQFYLGLIANIKKKFGETNLKKGITWETAPIIWEKTNIAPEDKQIIADRIDKSALKSTVIIRDMNDNYSKENNIAAAATVEVTNLSKLNFIILIPDNFGKKPIHEKKNIIAHEIKHSELLHVVENLYLNVLFKENLLLPHRVNTKALNRQQEFEADILANIQSFGSAKDFYKTYSLYKNYIIQKKDARNLIHQLPQDAYHNSQIIYKLLIAQKVWFQTLPADEKYGQIAYEKAFETHYQKQ